MIWKKRCKTEEDEINSQDRLSNDRQNFSINKSFRERAREKKNLVISEYGELLKVRCCDLSALD